MQAKPETTIPTVDFFLGALSPSGFSGWFAQAAAEPGARPWLIKAGPGCGKSTFMRRIADKAAAQPAGQGAYIERIHCSSDPASLDGVRLPTGDLVLDATAPHTLDCKYPDAAERIISFNHTLDHAYLEQHSAEVLAAGNGNTALLQRAAADFALACALLQRRRQFAASLLDADKLDRFTARLASRLMPARRGAKRGVQRIRLLSAPTPGGITTFAETVPALADTIYVIQDAYGAAAARMLSLLAEHAAQNGYEAIVCRCASDQSKTDHLILPGLRLAVVTANPWHPLRYAGQKTIRAARFLDGDRLEAKQGMLRFQKRIAGQLIARTCQTQAEAKRVHDTLETYYVHATDFACVDALRHSVEAELFGQTAARRGKNNARL